MLLCRRIALFSKLPDRRQVSQGCVDGRDRDVQVAADEGEVGTEGGRLLLEDLDGLGLLSDDLFERLLLGLHIEEAKCVDRAAAQPFTLHPILGSSM